MKWFVTVDCHCTRKIDNVIQEMPARFTSEAQTLLTDLDMDEQLTNAISTIDSRIESFQKSGSAWVIDQLTSVLISYASYEPLAMVLHTKK